MGGAGQKNGKPRKLLTTGELKATWKAISFAPNKPQQEAIFADFGPVLVTAGPGSDWKE